MRLACIDPKRIHQARLRAGMTQDDVAFRLRELGHKANARSIRRWESGQHAPHANVVPALAGAMGVTIEDIYQRDAASADDDEEDEAALRRIAHLMIDRGHEDIAAEVLRRVAAMRTRRRPSMEDALMARVAQVKRSKERA